MRASAAKEDEKERKASLWEKEVWMGISRNFLLRDETSEARERKIRIKRQTILER